ncbi:MAG TPA: hypothetical protein VJQ77_09675 [Novosphingobium sp.]|nr:hypothetical protein [Novosphingobium sp.]
MPSFSNPFWLRNRRRIADVRGIIERRRFDAIRRRFYDELWQRAAQAIGATAERLSNGLVQISRGGFATFVNRSDVMLDSAIAARLLLDKALTYDWLSGKDLRVPRRAAFGMTSLGVAEEFLVRQAGPVVVKPADGTGCGHGVTTGITSLAGLHAAACHAAAFHSRLLVEEQLTGSSFRLLYLDGEFIDAVRRDSPVVVGDGRSSIRHLALQENDSRREAAPITALSPLMIDRESRNTLATQGRSPGYVPGIGEVVQVKLAVNENAAGQNHVVREQVHPEIIDIGRRIVRDFRIGLAGLDVTSHDIAAPVSQGETIFNEINAGPGLHHHYLVANPECGADVAPVILEHMFTTQRGVLTL